MTDMPKSETPATAPARWKLWLGYALIAVAALRAALLTLVLALRSSQSSFEAGEALGREMAVWIIALPIAWFLARKVRDRNVWPRPLIYGAALFWVAFLMRLGALVESF